MELDSLSTFAGVARSGSFASHAREKGTDPSSVSRQMAALEDERRRSLGGLVGNDLGCLRRALANASCGIV